MIIQEKYIRENGSNFMLIELEENQIESYHIKMLLKNIIHKFLPMNVKTINNKQIFYYNITSKQPISRIYETSKLKQKDVLNIIMNISQISSIVNEYLLELDNVVLNPEYMYMDINDKSIYFTYSPIVDKGFSESLKEFFEYILEHLDHNDKNAVQFTYGIYQKILQDSFDLKSIVDNMGEVESDDQKPNYNGEHTNEQVIDSIIPEVIVNQREELNKKIYNCFLFIKGILLVIIVFIIFNAVMPKYRLIDIKLVTSLIVIICCAIVFKVVDYLFNNHKMLFTKIIENKEVIPYSFSEETSVVVDYTNITNEAKYLSSKMATEKLVEESISEYTKTQLLSDYIKQSKIHPKCRLVVQDEDEEHNISIDQMPFIIGSLAANCNYHFDNKLISRIHLKITNDGENNYMVEDLNSTNGTFINEERIQPNQKLAIENGDIIKVAIMQLKFVID